MLYLWIKALHVISIVAWMAGIMYLPRLFVYHSQAPADGEPASTFVVMERRLYRGIMQPAMIATFVFGLAMVALNTALVSSAWFLVKFAAALGIAGVQGYYGWARKKFEQGERPRTSLFWRIMNEAPFILFIVIVIMVIVRPF